MSVFCEVCAPCRIVRPNAGCFRMNRVGMATATRDATAKTSRIIAEAHGLRADSSSDMAMMGASSPTAPCTRTALPIVVPMTPASMRMGSRVPSAVEVSAIASAMYVAAATPVVPDAATAAQDTASPIPKHASHVSRERLPARPCTSSTLISVPAMRKSMPMPTSRNTVIGSVEAASPRPLGPTMTPRMRSQTTSGTRLWVSDESRARRPPLRR